MNKAYLLVVCMLAASFTGCLSDNTSDLEEQQNTEEETIEPVGNHNNETHDYDILIGEIQNLTDEIEDLNKQIDILSEDLQSLESYRYNPPENSNHTVSAWQCSLEYNEQNVSYGISDFCGIFPAFELIKEGNFITVNYKGLWLSEDIYYNSSVNCSMDLPIIEFYNVDGVIIFEFMDQYSASSSFVEKNSEGCSWTDQFASEASNIEKSNLNLWNSLKFSLPEETARMMIAGGIEGYTVFEHFTFA